TRCISTKAPSINFWAMGLWHYLGHLLPMKIMQDVACWQRSHSNAPSKRQTSGSPMARIVHSAWGSTVGSWWLGVLGTTSAWTILPSGIRRIWHLVSKGVLSLERFS